MSTNRKKTGNTIFNKLKEAKPNENILFQLPTGGGKTIILARFIPVVRTFAPLVAGVGKMDHKKFLIYNIVGALLWGAGVVLLGYWFGSKIPHLEQYIQYVLIAIIVFSLGSSVVHILREEKIRKRLIEKIHKKLTFFSSKK